VWVEGKLPRLSFVLGKGGVGKSTVAAALAVAAHREGARVLAVEIGEATGLARALGVVLEKPLETKRSPFGVGVVRFEGSAALSEYLTRVLHLGPLLGGVLASPLYSAFVDAAPGLKDLMVAGKIRAELLFEHDGFRSRWDWIVVDTGASGHALELLRTPLVMADTFTAGRVRRESGGIRNLYADPQRTTVHVVATPEEMPVAEAIATVSRLRELELPLGTAIVNRCRPPVPTGTEEVLRRLAATTPPPESGDLLLAARRELGWVRLQEDAIVRLRQGTALPLLSLPDLPAGPEESVLTRLAGLISGALP